ncbi:unnamed protein product, partial [Ectocarpus sp. 8 AP-2014]
AILVWNILNSFDRASITGKTTFSDNSADLRGGAICADSTAFTIDGETSFINNRASGYGGAIYMQSGTLAATGNTSVLGNVAPSGGGMYCGDGASFVFDGVTLFENNTEGAIETSFSEGIVLGSTSFVRNTATEVGGAVDVFRGTFSTGGRTTFVENTSGGVGGAIAISQDSTLSVSGLTTFLENKADNNGGMGRAVYGTDSTILVEPGTNVSSNTAVSGAGGGIYSSNAVATINGATFASNTAVWGMAFFSSGSLEDSGPVNTTACVFERNSADDGGAFYSAAGYDVVQDCSFRANFAGTTPEPKARQGAYNGGKRSSVHMTTRSLLGKYESAG